MADEQNLEKRLTSLEDAVARLQRQFAGVPPQGEWLESVIGAVTDHEAFQQALAYGRAYRHADRPTDNPGEKP